MRSIAPLLLVLAAGGPARGDDGFVPPATVDGLVGSYARTGFRPGRARAAAARYAHVLHRVGL